MNDPASRIADDADALRSAAQRLHADIADPDCTTLVPAALRAIEDALQALSRSCYTAGHAFVPLGAGHVSVTERYARAAASWPSPRGGIGPSPEQQVRVLSSLHDAGAALRGAAAHCGRAAGNLAATMEPVPPHLQRRSEAA